MELYHHHQSPGPFTLFLLLKENTTRCYFHWSFKIYNKVCHSRFIIARHSSIRTLIGWNFIKNISWYNVRLMIHGSPALKKCTYNSIYLDTMYSMLRFPLLFEVLLFCQQSIFFVMDSLAFCVAKDFWRHRRLSNSFKCPNPIFTLFRNKKNLHINIFQTKLDNFFFIKGRLLKNNTKYKKSQNNQKERKIYMREKIEQIMNNFFLFSIQSSSFHFPFFFFLSTLILFFFSFFILRHFFTIIQVAFRLVNESC